jgi:predicted ATP-dependent serine protease
MFFHRKQTITQIEEKEEAIAKVKKAVHTNMDKDIQKINKINRVLSNGVILQVFHAVGGKNG